MASGNDVYTRMSPELARRFCKESASQSAYGEVKKLLRKGETLLDVACGNGIGALWYPSEGYLGVDISPPLITVAREEHPDYRFRVVEASQPLPFPPAAFDVTVCKSTLEHLPSPEDALELFDEIIRVSRRLAIVVWHTPPVFGHTDEIRTFTIPQYGRVFQSRFRKQPFVERVAQLQRSMREAKAGPHDLWLIEPS